MWIRFRRQSKIKKKLKVIASNLDEIQLTITKTAPNKATLISVFPNKTVADKAAKAVEKNRTEAAKLMKMEFTEGEVVFSQNSLTQE